MKKDSFYLKIVGVIFLSIAGILYLNVFDDYLHPYVEDKALQILIPIVIFFLLTKLVGVMRLQDVEGKNILQLFVLLCYEFRYGLAVLIFFWGTFNPFQKELSFANVINEFYQENTEVQTVTVYHIHDNVIYDHENKVYHYYNNDLNIETNNTYELTYFKDSRIVTNLKGPINSHKQNHEDKVQIKKMELIDGKVHITWKPFYVEGNQVQQYRVESFVRQDDGTLMRSGSQIVVYDAKTTAVIENLSKDREYQFAIKPLHNKIYDEKYQGVTEFVTIPK